VAQHPAGESQACQFVRGHYLSTLVRGNTSFLVVGVILIIFGWAWGARTIRSMALSLREREFVNVARFSSVSTFSIIIHEMFPYVYA
jgi:peptide/nickel transport system permease protein